MLTLHFPSAFMGVAPPRHHVSSYASATSLIPAHELHSHLIELSRTPPNTHTARLETSMLRAMTAVGVPVTRLLGLLGGPPYLPEAVAAAGRSSSTVILPHVSQQAQSSSTAASVAGPIVSPAAASTTAAAVPELVAYAAAYALKPPRAAGA
jgi:hypothetical protein